MSYRSRGRAAGPWPGSSRRRLLRRSSSEALSPTRYGGANPVGSSAPNDPTARGTAPTGPTRSVGSALPPRRSGLAPHRVLRPRTPAAGDAASTSERGGVWTTRALECMTGSRSIRTRRFDVLEARREDRDVRPRCQTARRPRRAQPIAHRSRRKWPSCARQVLRSGLPHPVHSRQLSAVTSGFPVERLAALLGGWAATAPAGDLAADLRRGRCSCR